MVSSDLRRIGDGSAQFVTLCEPEVTDMVLIIKAYGRNECSS